MRADCPQIIAAIDDLIEREVAATVDQSEREEIYPVDLVKKICALGVPALVTSPTTRSDATTLFCTLIERLATSWLALAESVHLQTLATCGLALHGSDHLKARFLESMQVGKFIGSNCLSEPAAGSDLSLIETTAKDNGDTFVINGVKSWVGHAGVSNLLNVYAKTGAAGIGGLTCFLIDADSAGVRVQRKEEKMGVRALPTAKIIFDNVSVSRERIVGRVNRGVIVAQSFFTQGRLGIAACAVGVAQAALNRAVSYAKTRSQFGKKIIEFQGISFLLADMAVEIEAARQLLHRACREKAVQGLHTEMLAAQAKLFSTEAAMKVTTNAVQILGAYGYTTAEPVERWMREAKLLQIIEGTNQIQRVMIASRL
jgi:alkylation response protein AidB-like acyl-CoA dehydrogenase